MRLVTLKITGYRQFLDPTVLHFPEGLSGICGPNGVGKSKLIEAIGYALYGAASPVLPKGDKVTDIPSRASQNGKADACVELTLEVRGQPYEIVRARHSASIRLQGAAEPLAEGSKPVTKTVVELLRLSPAAYYGTFVAQQKEVAGLQTLRAEERKRLVNRLIGIEQVEYAVKLASAERKVRDNRLEITRESLGKPSAEAIAERDALRSLQEAARAEAEVCEAARAAAQHAYDEVAATVADIQKRMDALKEQRDALTPLQESRATLETALVNARQRLDHAINATQALGAARAALAQTADAQAQAERWNRLAAIAQARTQQKEIRRRLAEDLAPRASEREALQRALSEDDATLETLRAELSEHAQTRARAEQLHHQAKERREQQAQRLEAAQRLGPDDACETCGQKFGDELETALAHYAAERDDAQQEEAQAALRVAALLEKEATQKARVRECEQARAQRYDQLKAYDEAPGEIVSAQRTLDELTALLAAYAPDELTQSYDPATHGTVRATADLHAQAEADVARLESLSATESGVGAEIHDLEHHLQALAQQQHQIEAALEEEALLAANLVSAQERLMIATATREASAEKARGVSQQLIRITTQLEAAEQEVERARVREARITEAACAVFVAERTETLLNQLLIEITAEARPRLTELLDGWARALLGQRFRQIELAEDYSILADNGTGLHQMTHFSGGEQTLLAVMLRVAIALFCRERAGFETSFLILDEVFGDQDGEHRTQLVQFLEEVKEQFHQILVINHVEDVTEMLDCIIDVKPSSLNTSTAELRS